MALCLSFGRTARAGHMYCAAYTANCAVTNMNAMNYNLCTNNPVDMGTFTVKMTSSSNVSYCFPANGAMWTKSNLPTFKARRLTTVTGYGYCAWLVTTNVANTTFPAADCRPHTLSTFDGLPVELMEFSIDKKNK